MTAPEVARIYQVGYRTVVRHCTNGKLPALRVALVPLRRRVDGRKLVWQIEPADARAWAARYHRGEL
jgi:hypothetical protein